MIKHQPTSCARDLRGQAFQKIRDQPNGEEEYHGFLGPICRCRAEINATIRGRYTRLFRAQTISTVKPQSQYSRHMIAPGWLRIKIINCNPEIDDNELRLHLERVRRRWQAAFGNGCVMSEQGVWSLPDVTLSRVCGRSARKRHPCSAVETAKSTRSWNDFSATGLWSLPVPPGAARAHSCWLVFSRASPEAMLQEAGDFWVEIYFRPGKDPLGNLQAALVEKFLPESEAKVDTSVRDLLASRDTLTNYRELYEKHISLGGGLDLNDKPDQSFTAKNASQFEDTSLRRQYADDEVRRLRRKVNIIIIADQFEEIFNEFNRGTARRGIACRYSFASISTGMVRCNRDVATS